MIPARSQLLLPLLETIDEMGGSASWAKWGERKRYPWRQAVHWVRQEAATRGLIERSTHGVWTLSEEGRTCLHTCQSGLILVVYETPEGQAVWAEAQTAAGSLSSGSLQLIFTSPPYPILKGRQYGTFTEADIINLIVNCAREWKRSLTDDGSIVLNFKDVWLPKSQTGGAVRSLYQERLLLSLIDDVGLHFADRHFWKNPSHTPESSWVTVQRVRCNQDVESLLWLSKSPNPFADNRPVMVDAKQSTIDTYRLRAARALKGTLKLSTGPSTQKNNFEEQMEAVSNGHTLKVIPRNLLELSNANNHAKLKEVLTKNGLPRHDAMMPVQLAEFFIRFLTSAGDTVYDPFLGSGTTALAAQNTGRKWLGCDRSLPHLLASALRLDSPCFDPAYLGL